MSDHWMGDDVVVLFDSDVPTEPVIKHGPSGCHPSPENEMPPLKAFLLSLALTIGMVAGFTALFYGVTLLF